VLSEPIDGLISLQKTHSKQSATVTVWPWEWLVGVVEDFAGETEDGVYVNVFSQDSGQLSLNVSFCNTVDEMLEEVVDWALPFGNINALGRKFHDSLGDAGQSSILIGAVILH
jgi:hypothetical protein